jgi:hypothetical protein
VIARRLKATLPPLAVVVAAVAVGSAAAAKTTPTCTSRAGSTVLQDGSARVFKHDGDIYACAIRSTFVSKLTFARNVELAGRYVLYEAVPNAVTTDLNMYDTATGRNVAIGDANSAGHYSVQAIDGYAMTARGAIVWLFDSSVCVPMASSCSLTSDVFEYSAAGHGTLATATTSGGDAYPFSELGLSADGTIAYWLKYGQPDESSLS